MFQNIQIADRHNDPHTTYTKKGAQENNRNAYITKNLSSQETTVCLTKIMIFFPYTKH